MAKLNTLDVKINADYSMVEGLIDKVILVLDQEGSSKVDVIEKLEELKDGLKG